MDNCAMNPPEPHSDARAAAEATPRAPDYKPRDRLDPKWRPGLSVRTKLAPRSGEVLDDPWMYSQRSLRERSRLLPAQRLMLGLLLASGVAAAGLVGLSMSGPDEGQRWAPPARQPAMDEGRSPSALRISPEPASIQVDAPHAGPTAVESTAHAVATVSVPEDAAGARIGLAAASRAALESDAQTGSPPAPVPSVAPGMAEQAKEPAAAQVKATLLPPAALPSGDDALRTRRPRTEARGVECSEAQQAMQLCGMTEGVRR